MKKLHLTLIALISCLIILNSCSESRYALKKIKTENQYLAESPKATYQEVSPKQIIPDSNLEKPDDSPGKGQYNSGSSHAFRNKVISAEQKIINSARQEVHQFRQDLKNPRKTNLAEIKKAERKWDWKTILVVIFCILSIPFILALYILLYILFFMIVISLAGG